MIKTRRKIGFYLLLKSRFWLIFLFVALLFGVRWTKGAGYLDFYSVLLKPILPGTAQREWIQAGDNIEKTIRLKLLLEDNIRFDKSRLALSNAELVKRVAEMCPAYDRHPASPIEARKMLGLETNFS